MVCYKRERTIKVISQLVSQSSQHEAIVVLDEITFSSHGCHELPRSSCDGFRSYVNVQKS